MTKKYLLQLGPYTKSWVRLGSLSWYNLGLQPTPKNCKVWQASNSRDNTKPQTLQNQKMKILQKACLGSRPHCRCIMIVYTSILCRFGLFRAWQWEWTWQVWTVWGQNSQKWAEMGRNVPKQPEKKGITLPAQFCNILIRVRATQLKLRSNFCQFK